MAKFRVVRKEPAIMEIVVDSSGKTIAEMTQDFTTENPDVVQRLRERGYIVEEVIEEVPVEPEVPEEPKKKAKRGK